jgi:hypothetical protein
MAQRQSHAVDTILKTFCRKNALKNHLAWLQGPA